MQRAPLRTLCILCLACGHVVAAEPGDAVVVAVSGPCYVRDEDGVVKQLQEHMDLRVGQQVHCDVAGKATLQYRKTQRYVEVKPYWNAVEKPIAPFRPANEPK